MTPGRLRRIAVGVRHGLAHAHPSLDESVLERALELGVSFLRRRQGRDGVWKGFLLPPGAATTWLTAHVAWVVEDVLALTDACRRAALYLESVGPGDGGWGYNRHVGVDSDSTAQALLVLKRFERAVPEFLLQTLLRAQASCGGFSTYIPTGASVNGWQAPHPDVTVVAVETLRRYGHREATLRAVSWLDAAWMSSEFASYWWVGPEYGLWACARTGLRSRRIEDAITTALAGTRSTPRASHLLAAGLALDLDRTQFEAVALHLLRTQFADGSWPCSPCLRVTDPSETETRLDLRWTCYADARRVFSTAHSLAALQALVGAQHR
jgi:hypothetical protein